MLTLPSHRGVLLVAGILACAGCGYLAPDPLAELLGRLPAGQALYLYLDGESLWASETLGPLVEAALGERDEYRQFAEAAGVDYRRDVQALALSLGEKEVSVAARGRFAEGALARYLAAKGAECSHSLRQRPCSFVLAESGDRLSFEMPAADVLTIERVDRSAQGSPKRPADGTALGRPARERLARGALLWAMIDPAGLERAMRDPPAGFVNLTVVARALEKSQRAFLSAEASGGGLALTLEASCRGEQEAAEMQSLLAGLNRFAAAFADTGKQGVPSEWGMVLQSARFTREKSTVQVVWSVDQDLLQGLLAPR